MSFSIPVTVPFTTLPSKASFSPPRLSLRSAAKSSRVGNVVVAIRSIVSLIHSGLPLGRPHGGAPQAELVKCTSEPAHPDTASVSVPAHGKKRVPVPVSGRSTVRARQRTGCRERQEQRPPDGARLSLEGKRGQAPHRVPALSQSKPWLRRRPSRAQAPEAAAEAEAEAPGRCPSPGSPSHPGTSASPEGAAEAAAEAEGAAAAAATRSYKSVHRAGSALDTWYA